MTHLEHLDIIERERYADKIQQLNGVDPYGIDKNSLTLDTHCLPKLVWGDIVNYFVYTKSAYTSDDFKAFKSLEAYEMFSGNCVKNIGCKEINGFSVLIGKVLHSLHKNETPSDVWVVLKKDGAVISAHCSCVAGLGECCSHVGAILFWMQDYIQRMEARTVTDVPACWMEPASMSSKYLRVHEIDFTTPMRKRQKREEALADKSISLPSTSTTVKKYQLSDKEKFNFLQKLQAGGHSAPILNVTDPFYKNYSCNTDYKEQLSLG